MALLRAPPGPLPHGSRLGTPPPPIARTQPLLVGLAAALTFTLVPSLHTRATSFDHEPLTPYDLAAIAGLVFEGEVAAVWYEDAGGDYPFAVTRALIEVDYAYKGSVASGAVVLGLPGGQRSDGVWVWMDHAPQVAVGDAVLVHAGVRNEEQVGVGGWTLGLLRFEVDDLGEPFVENGRAEVVGTLDVAEGATFFPEPAEGLGVPAGAISPDEVRDVVAEAVTASEEEGTPAVDIAGYLG